MPSGRKNLAGPKDLTSERQSSSSTELETSRVKYPLRPREILLARACAGPNVFDGEVGLCAGAAFDDGEQGDEVGCRSGGARGERFLGEPEPLVDAGGLCHVVAQSLLRI